MLLLYGTLTEGQLFVFSWFLIRNSDKRIEELENELKKRKKK